MLCTARPCVYYLRTVCQVLVPGGEARRGEGKKFPSIINILHVKLTLAVPKLCLPYLFHPDLDGVNRATMASFVSIAESAPGYYVP